ncbi:MAG: 5'-nucleotidase C-terminal domain-containing protein [Pyrinomonadaceae bacterium]|nr:5'-nucleotidase C-terminal domain-containing protein [Pyrinomonadaceae bacterium]
MKIGLFGVLTPETARTSKASADVQFLDPCETARKTAAEIRAQGAQVVVALTHLTMRQDKALAACAPLDVIIGGHEHSLLQSLAGRTPIFKMGSDARNLGRIDLNIEAATGKLTSIDWEIIPVTNEVPDEPQVAILIAEYEKRLSAELDKVVGSTGVQLDARQETNRSRETNLGSFVADAYRQALKADVALLNGGSIRTNATFGPGALTKRDLLSILPFENHLVKIEVTGALLREALEHGVSQVVEEREAGQFPQISGMRFVFDGRRPSGKRVVSVSINNQPLDDRKTYTLATSAYVYGGGDGYTMLRSARPVINAEEGPVEADVLINAVAQEGREIKPQRDGRIRRLDDESEKR